MGAGQREDGVVVIEGRRLPHRGAVADLTLLRKLRRNVIRVGSSVEIVQVTRHACGVRRAQDHSLVTGRARQRGVRAGQRPTGCRMVEGRAGPIHRAVADRAVGGEADRDVIWIGGLLVIRQMAVRTLRIRRRQHCARVA